jgi:hypothetical protein
MKASLVNRAAPLLITTLVAAAPAVAIQASGMQAWAQTTNAPTGPSGTAPPAGSAPTGNSQTSNGPSGTVHKAMPHGHHATMGRRPGETMQSVVERRITNLHDKLHITAEQGQQWDQFAQVMRDNARQMDQSHQQRAARLGTMSAVDSVQSYAQIEQQRAQDMQKLVPAFQTLYASLSDQQKKSADQLFRNYAENAQARRQGTTTR